MIDCSKIPLQDKGCHLITGFSITLIIGFVAYYLGFDNHVVYGLIAGALVGAAKEAYNEYTYDGADFFDFFATIVGVFFGGAIVVLLT